MPSSKVLVIDDDASIHRAVERRLEDVVDQVLKTDSPTKGIQVASQEKPDVILLDVNMPQLDGFKVCRLLKESPATRDVQILFLTADSNPDNLAKALDAGAPKAHADARDNLVAELTNSFGDIAAAFADAPHTFACEFRQHRGGCHAMECRGVIASLRSRGWLRRCCAAASAAPRCGRSAGRS